MAELAVSDGQVFEIHTIGGEELTIKADKYEIDAELNRIYFYDAKGREIKDWIIFLSGVAGIRARKPRRVTAA